MNCPSCSKSILENTRFCYYCGQLLPEAAIIPATPANEYVPRYHGLDALRGIAMLLGIVLHAALPYVEAPEIWPSDKNSSPAIGTLVHFIHIWRMPLFFILVGFFAHLIVAKHSWSYWWGNRFLRIGIPVILFSPLLSLVMPSLFLYGKTGNLVFLYSNEGQPYHLWFLWHIVIFLAATIVIRSLQLFGFRVGNLFNTIGINRFQLLIARLFTKLYQTIFGSRFPFFFIILCYFINLPFGGELIINPVGSGLYFLLGYCLFSNHYLFTFIQSYWRYYFFLSLLLFGVFAIGDIADIRDTLSRFLPGIMNVQIDEEYSLFDGLQYFSNICCATLFSYAFIGLAENKLGSYNANWKFISDGSYWMYIIHLPIVAFLTFSMFDLQLPIEAKFLIAIFVTSILCLITYKYLVRSTFIGLLLNGKRHPFTRILM